MNKEQMKKAVELNELIMKRQDFFKFIDLKISDFSDAEIILSVRYCSDYETLKINADEAKIILDAIRESLNSFTKQFENL